MKKLIVFGGTGFVGHRVVVRSLARGFQVIVATRGGRPVEGSPTEALARRVRLVGGRTAGLEALRDPSEAAAAPPRTKKVMMQGKEIEAVVDSGDGAGPDGGAAALQFVSIDAASRAQVFDFMHDNPDTTAVVSCVGLLTRDYHLAREVNGDTNTNIAAGFAHERLLPRATKLVYLSAEPYNKYDPYIIGSKHLLKGYFHGKENGEKAVLRNLGTRGAVLRPGFIYGTRHVTAPSGTADAGRLVPLPLGVVGWPLEVVLRAVGGRKLLTPPVHVDVVAEAAVRACDWAGLGGAHEVHGIVDVYRMHDICAMEDPTAARAPAAGEAGQPPLKEEAKKG